MDIPSRQWMKPDASVSFLFLFLCTHTCDCIERGSVCKHFEVSYCSLFLYSLSSVCTSHPAQLTSVNSLACAILCFFSMPVYHIKHTFYRLFFFLLFALRKMGLYYINCSVYQFSHSKIPHETVFTCSSSKSFL